MFSCTKESPEVEEVPTSFNQHVLLEGFSGEWCPPCATSFEDFIKPTLDSYPNIAHYISYHIEDPFSTSESEFLSDKYGVFGVPNTMVDRYDFPDGGVLSNQFLSSRVETRSTHKSDIGLKLKTDQSGLEGQIRVDLWLHNPFSDELYLNIYLLQNEVQAINQLGTNDPNYKHKFLFRESVTPFGGVQIEASTTGEMQSFNFDLDLSHYPNQEISFVAFVEVQNQILQSQYVKLGENTSWD